MKNDLLKFYSGQDQISGSQSDSAKLISLNNVSLTVKGKIIKTILVKEEWDEEVINPEYLISNLKKLNIKADLFTFVQRLPASRPRYNYYMEWESVAAIPIVSFEHWIENQIPKQSRNRIKKAMKLGVVIKEVDFGDKLVEGISEIYNEVPVKQGRKNKHYGMSLSRVKQANITYLERAKFIGAYYKDELIGYIKIVKTDNYARTMGILGKVCHRDKSPMNLLLAKAVEICAESKVPFLTYARYDYGKYGSDTLKDFKKNNGFENILIPRYYVPISLFGKIILLLRMHNGIKHLIPKKFVKRLQEIRKKWNSKKI
jgi:hypothetical protein